MNVKSAASKTADALRKIAFELTRNHVYAYAAQASFFVIISAVPFLMLVLSVLQAVIPISETEVTGTVLAFLPEQLAQLAKKLIGELYTKSGVSVTLVTAVLLLWSSSRGVKAISYGLKTVYHNRQSSGYVKSTLFSLLYTLIFMSSIILTIGILLFGKYLAELGVKYFKPLTNVIGVLMSIRNLILLIVLTLVFMIAYKFLATSKIRFRSHFPGAFLAAAAWLLFSFVYSVYIENFSNFSYVYGSLAAVVLMMLWLYFCMIILLLGAELNVWLYRSKFKIRSLSGIKGLRLQLRRRKK